tara:strand:+ start:1738 stop:2085 length:348 start_codon:yes stop_codon:yes gene_type:complete
MNMININLIDRLPKRKNSRVSYSTIYYNDNNLFGLNTSVGIGFIKYLKTKKTIQKIGNGQAKWYHAGSNTLTKAITQIRKWYRLKVKSKSWKKARVKTYNTSNIEEIILNLKAVL